jgi:4-hydroxy-tetrahydrodipicolinate synthase
MRLTGVIPANILPLTSDLAIDEAAYRSHLETLVSTPGVGGLTCNGHAAEVASLDREERRRALALAVEQVAGRVPVVSGIYAENHLHAAAQARDAEAEGADALLVFPLNALLFDAGGEAGRRHIEAIAEAVRLPLVVFLYPAWTNLQYDLDTFLRICEIPSVTAIKDWSLDIRVHETYQRALRETGRPISYLTSFSTNLLPALTLGADGILSGHGSVIAGMHAELFDSIRDGRMGDARAVYERIQVLTAVTYRSPMANMYARMKEHLRMLGHELTAAVRPPLWHVDDTERKHLSEALAAAGLHARVPA